MASNTDSCERKLSWDGDIALRRIRGNIKDTIWPIQGTRYKTWFGRTQSGVLGCVCVLFWTGFLYLMTYGLDGIDTQYP